ncbi:hypothetical protein HD806DRAFT_261474 [Xylariaceae sp. AK1471]|nr:hypothetical protein HD806DRAFT_261474 [Xylariaceae sp. AK1471]
MPPRKRGRPAAVEPEPEPEPVRDDDTDQDEQDSLLQNNEDQQGQIRFFNTTFSTFRVSPLYIGRQALTKAGLAILSRRVRDTLVGDVVRGVQVGLEGDATLGRAGALERVEWRECDMQAIIPTLADNDMGKRETSKARGKRAVGRTRRRIEARQLLCLELEYENVTFSALMLPSLDDTPDKERGDDESRLRGAPSWTGMGNTGAAENEDQDSNAFAHFPLLLTRMPAPLKAVLVDFLSSTFDCRISPLHLGTRTLIRSWERWIQDSGVARGKVLNKDVALTLGFHLEPKDNERKGEPAQLGLKTIDVVVPAEEVRRFLRVGKIPEHNSNGDGRKRPADDTVMERERVRRRKLGGGKDEEGWAWREALRQNQDNNNNDNNDGLDTFDQPFADALARYLDHHLALDMFHPGVRVLRVVCDAFALSEGRMKVFAPPSRGQTGGETGAVETFVRDLVRRAQGREWSQSALRLANLVADGH